MRKILFGLVLIPIFLNAKILEPQSFWDIQKISKPLINEQGTEIIFTKRRIDKQNDKFVSEIWIMGGDGENQGFFAKGSNAQWFPDGKRVSFLKKDANGIRQIFMKHINHQNVSQITNHEADIGHFSISPGGKLIVFAALNEYEDSWTVEIPGKKEGKQYNWTKEPKVIKTLHWRYDGKGELKNGEHHLYLVSSNGGAAQKISDWGLDYVGDLSWKDESRVIFTGNNELNDMHTPWKQTNIFSLDLNSRVVETISPKNGVYTKPVVSPNS